jgi:hypothetical protein
MGSEALGPKARHLEYPEYSPGGGTNDDKSSNSGAVRPRTDLQSPARSPTPGNRGGSSGAMIKSKATATIRQRQSVWPQAPADGNSPGATDEDAPVGAPAEPAGQGAAVQLLMLA